MYTIVGLGNHGDRYVNTRHNIGRDTLLFLQKEKEFTPWEYDKMISAQVSNGELAGSSAQLVLPETYMNRSGLSVKKVYEHGGSDTLIVIHDDLDLPLGSFKISFGKSSAGNKGVSSIIKEIGTSEFLRIRVGIAPVTFWSKFSKRTQGSGFVLSRFSKKELHDLEEIQRSIIEALSSIIKDGKEKAMNTWNQKR